MNLAYLHGKPDASGQIRCCNSDFYVEELLHFEPDGAGEHLWLWIEKDGQNTNFVAKQLGKAFGIAAKLVSTSGMKDRHAVTKQWFCLPWPIKKDIPEVTLESAQILKTVRHGKKLKTGTHKNNLFRLKIALQSYNKETLVQRLEKIQAYGVANYFGEQRFGRNGDNVENAIKMLSGELIVKDRKLKSIYLSAARSEVFNQVLHQRIVADLFKPLEGDAFILSGSHSYFVEEHLTDDTLSRFASADILLSGPLVGEGEPIVKNKSLEFEKHALAEQQNLVDALSQAGLKQDRRALQLRAENFTWQFVDGEEQSYLELSFVLPAGCFATSILREILLYQDMGQTHANTSK
ncbi:tRNA pseudouridine(13) synthase TruD [Catenovulum sediminis]|uniref:tRNA pseudouridine synthase D n=1 Tax=Catenovulum sediminis TaxID=1740262 RepID=A0ABV1RGJ2_9ALTE|nr:tRNA pseudouridine(13) synthase TruD [Catenovulum sediminis]